MQHIFIVGSKGIPGKYGGFETFVDKLTEYHQNRNDIKYHVACKGESNGEYEYHNARCFEVKVPNIGAAQAICYDVMALWRCCKYIRKNHIERPVVCVLACRIGPFAAYFRKNIHRLDGRMFVNPDGHEWKRAKWSWAVKKYWKFSERLMVKQADLVICDSKSIEKYMQEEYQRYCPNTTFIAYGSETVSSDLTDEDERYTVWMKEQGISSGSYYLAVGRFVPENNYETMIREFMQSDSEKDLVIIATENIPLFKKLESKIHFRADKRIKFAGTVYDQELLKKIRENAYGYIHGHEVGGTNPSLLEALGSTKLNLVLDVTFNREVAEDAALYWSKETGTLSVLIQKADSLDKDEISRYGDMAKKRIRDEYSWQLISDKYAKVFMSQTGR